MQPCKSLKLIVASNESWYGLATDDAPHFEPTQINLEFKPNLKTFVKLTSPTRITFMNGVQNITKCVDDFLKTLNCSVICYPLYFNYLTNLPVCKNYQEANCMEKEYYIESENNLKYQMCLKPTQRLEYRWRVSYDDETVVNNRSMKIWFYVVALNLKLSEEVLVIGLTDLLGSVGGSLGLFLGFSFYTYISDFLSYFCQKISTPSD